MVYDNYHSKNLLLGVIMNKTKLMMLVNKSLLLAVIMSACTLMASHAGTTIDLTGDTYTVSNTGTGSENQKVGTGQGEDGRTVIVDAGAVLNTINDSAISLGSNATINISGSVTNTATNNVGDYRTGSNTIEVRSNSVINVLNGGEVVALGTQTNAEAINVHGFGNTITIQDGALVEGTHSAAIWFQDTMDLDAGYARNAVINNGTIRRDGGGAVFGSQANPALQPGIDFTNGPTGIVEGDLLFGSGDDRLEFVAGSGAQNSITGRVNGGGGNNSLVLSGAAGGNDELSQGVSNFSTLTKTGESNWTISGSLSGFTKVYATNGVLTLTGNNSNYSGHLYINPDAYPDYGGNPVGSAPDPNGAGANTDAMVVARAQSLPTNNTGNIANIENYGVLRINQETGDNGSYAGQIIGDGSLQKTGGGILTLAPQAGENTYTGLTRVFEGSIAISDQRALGTNTTVELGYDEGSMTNTGGGAELPASDALGQIQFNANTEFTKDLVLYGNTVSTPPLTTQGGGGINTNGNTVLMRGAITGSGDFYKTGAGFLGVYESSPGALNYTGDTYIQGGTLQVNGRLGNNTAATVYVGANTRLEGGAGLPGTDWGIITGSVDNSGTVSPGQGFPFGTMTIEGDYQGRPGGVVEIHTRLSDATSPHSKLVIDGAVQTDAPTGVRVVNQYGSGDIDQGYEIIHFTNDRGDHNSQFRLIQDFYVTDPNTGETKGVVVAGNYAYWMDNKTVDAFGNEITHVDGLYLRNAVGVIHPGIPLYQMAPQALNTFNKLGTLQQRVGNRSWEAFTPDTAARYESGQALASLNPAIRQIERAGMWTRVEGSLAKFKPSLATIDANYDVDFSRAQIGVDTPLYKSPYGGTLTGGLSVHVAHVRSKITSQDGGGLVKSNGYGLGGSLTWYAENGLYVDAQGQVTWHRTDIDSDVLAQTRQVNNLHGYGYALSLEAGKEWAIGCNGWSLTPQAQFVYSKTNMDDFVDPQYAMVELEKSESYLGRLGVAVAREISFVSAAGDKRNFRGYGLLNAYQEFGDGSRTRVNNEVFATRDDRTWGGIAVGGSFDWCDTKYSTYGEIGARSSFKHFGDSRELYGEVGFRFNF